MKFMHHLLSLALMLSMIVHLGVGSAGTNPSPTKPYSGLAQGFYIPKLDLLTDKLHVGATIFYSLPSDCIDSDSVSHTQKYSAFYSNAESLYKTVSANFGIGASLKGAFTLDASLAGVTKNMISGNVSGLSLNLKEHSKEYSLTKDCINDQPLHERLLKDFETLDNKVYQPWQRQSWNKYQIFLEKYGSHVVEKVTSGSSISQYVFAESSNRYSQHDYMTSACLSLGGATGYGAIGIPGCANISKKEVNNVGSRSMEEKLVIRGGTHKTRAELMHGPDKNTIATFLREGKHEPSPIAYKFVSIWSILEKRFDGTSSMAKVLNLEQYFKGYLNFGCSIKRTSNKEILQKFILSEDSDPDVPTYKCILGTKGCHADSDCHRKLHKCVCAGDSCIRYKDVKLISGSTKREAYAYSSKNGRKRQGCKSEWFKCKCKNENTDWVESWPDAEGLSDIHHALAKGRSRIGLGKTNKKIK